MEKETKLYYKIVNQALADALIVSGCAYTTETFDGNQTIYVFEKEPAADKIVAGWGTDAYQEYAAVVDDLLLI